MIIVIRKWRKIVIIIFIIFKPFHHGLLPVFVILRHQFKQLLRAYPVLFLIVLLLVLLVLVVLFAESTFSWGDCVDCLLFEFSSSSLASFRFLLDRYNLFPVWVWHQAFAGYVRTVVMAAVPFI